MVKLIGAMAFFCFFTALATAQDTGEKAGCNLQGSSNVFVNGLPKLRLGDVEGCPGINYEIIEGLFINGQPAVRILPSENCVAKGSSNVFANGKPVTRQGDVVCFDK
ncbi:MAG: PAAR domain-containing protein [Stappiaceae bacterium]